MDFLELSHALRTNFHVAELQEPLRYARVYIDIENLSRMLRLEISTDLPADCTIYSVGFSEDRMGLCLIMHSKDWEEVKEGSQIPEFRVTWKVSTPESNIWTDILSGVYY